MCGDIASPRRLLSVAKIATDHGFNRKHPAMTVTPVYPPPTRPVVMGTDGMVSAGNMLATMAGVRMLAAGGNAFDAAVAVASTLGVVEPYHSGPGGTGTAIVRLAGESKSRALDFTGRTPAAADPERHPAETRDLGILAPMVPGNVAGWLELHRKHGSLDLERVFAPAIDYAENGYPTTYQNS
jgi:gamma-glutamyltranspeptidase/glutathione hydrolase